MLMGAIIGDIVGSRFEWNNIFTRGFLKIRNSVDFIV